VVENVKIRTIQPIINASVAKGSQVMTDEFNIYNKVKENGYDRILINIPSSFRLGIEFPQPMYPLGRVGHDPCKV
jgi:hypothetical protein